MNIATRSTQTRPKAPRIVLAILCAVAVVALSQCKMTADKVTGVDTTLSHDEKEREGNPGECASKCARKANDALEDERDRHDDNLEECRGNPACISAENARYQAAVNQIQEDRKHCIDGCHHQGGGRGRGHDH